MRTAEIRRRFLAHFAAAGHTVVPSAPLPAIDDPNLLFVPAGMVPFVPYFAGAGGVTPLNGNTGAPGSIVPDFTPDLRKAENRINMAVLVKF